MSFWLRATNDWIWRRTAKHRKARDRFREIGWGFYLKQEYGLARTNYLKAIKIERAHLTLRDPTLYVLLGHVFFQQKKFTRARRCYELACDRAPKSGKIVRVKALNEDYYHSYVANACFQAGQYEDAIQQFQRALKAELPNDLHAQVLNGLGTVYADRSDAKRDLEKALRYCLEAEICVPGNAVMVGDVGRVYHEQARDKQSEGSRDAAIALMKRAVERLEQACELAKRSSNGSGDFMQKIHEFRSDLGYCYYRLSQWIPNEAAKYQQDAINELDKALQQHPSDAEAAEVHDFKGWIFLEKSDHASAVNEYQKAYRLAPDNPIYSANLGYACYKNERYEDAIEQYRQALSLQSEGTDTNLVRATYHNMIGVCYDALDKSAEAIPEYENAVELNPNDPVLHDNLAKAYYAADRNDDAIREYQNLLKNEPQNPGYVNSLGNAYFSKKDYDSAIKAYTQAMKLDGQEPVYHYNLAEALRLHDRNEDAVSEYLEAIRLNSEEADYHLGLAHCYSAMKTPEAAENEYRKALKLNGKKPQYHYWVGLAYKRARQFEKAESEYRKVLTLEPNHPNAQRSLGLLYQAAGRYQEAVPLLQKLLKKTPKDVDLLMALGLSELEIDRTKRAINHLVRALELAPNDARAYSSLGQAHNLVEDYKSAAAVLEKGLSKFPDDQYIKEELEIAKTNLPPEVGVSGSVFEESVDATDKHVN